MTGTAGDEASSSVDGIGSGNGWGGMKLLYDLYYDMQRDGSYISGTNIPQDMMIRNVESWSKDDNNNNNNRNIVDLDDVVDNNEDVCQRCQMLPSNHIDKFCDRRDKSTMPRMARRGHPTTPLPPPPTAAATASTTSLDSSTMRSTVPLLLISQPRSSNRTQSSLDARVIVSTSTTSSSRRRP